MTNSSFTREDKVNPVTESFGALRRFVVSMPLLRRLLFPTVILSAVAVSLPQIFLWISGLLAGCPVDGDCHATFGYLNVTVPISLSLLAFVVSLALIARIISWGVFELGGLWALQTFHASMVRGLHRVRTTFFDQHPSGRLINRLVNDYESLSTLCVVRMGDTLQAFLEILSIAVMVVFAHPIGGILIVPTIAGFLYVQWGVSPMLQRLTAIRSSRLGEVLHRETDLIHGSPTFVMYNAERSLLRRLSLSVHRYVQISLLRVRIEAWGRLITGTITSTYSFAALLTVALAVHRGYLSIVFGAAIITIVLRLTPSCSWLAWSVSILIESIGIVKRTFEIVDLPDQTREEFAHDSKVAPDGTAKDFSGSIEFVDFSMSYRSDTPLILQNLNLNAAAGQRLGIIGRTGSGKTSLFQSLFRMVHVQNGDIRIGDRSIYNASPQTVRNLFSVVPQDPYLFEGTIASNLDPDGIHSPEMLRNALEKTGLGHSLDSIVLEGGKNLSLGERQLVCLARVLVQDRPYVLLDEPTSAVDNITDSLIQNALRTTLAGKTVIAIAHRLDTLGNYDQIVEMRDGNVVRSGTPDEIFRAMNTESVTLEQSYA